MLVFEILSVSPCLIIRVKELTVWRICSWRSRLKKWCGILFKVEDLDGVGLFSSRRLGGKSLELAAKFIFYDIIISLVGAGFSYFSVFSLQIRTRLGWCWNRSIGWTSTARVPCTDCTGLYVLVRTWFVDYSQPLIIFVHDDPWFFKIRARERNKHVNRKFVLAVCSPRART